MVKVSNSGWAEFTAIATGVAALATAAAAGVTARMAKRTKDVAEATEKAATAARDEVAAAIDQAEATRALARSAEHDRELAYQPLLSLQYGQRLTNQYQVVTISNVGSGPAIDMQVAMYPLPSDEFFFSDGPLHLAANSAVHRNATSQDRSQFRAHWFHRANNRDADAVLFCWDVFGNRHRFLIYRGYTFHEVRKRDEIGTETLDGQWWTDPQVWALEVSDLN